MVFSRGLLLSLGFTLLAGVMLFLYIRQKTTSIENKVNTLFQLVQEEASRNHKRALQERESNMVVQETTQHSSQLTEMNHETTNDDLINVSDDNSSVSDDDFTTDDDIETDSDSDDDGDGDEHGNGPEYGLDNIQNNSAKPHITSHAEIMNEMNVESNTGKKQEEHSDDESDIEDLGLEDIDDEIKTIDIETNQTIDYKKLSVAKLRELATLRGVDDPKKLKKKELIELLESL